jgi:hypothetical protein
VSYDTLIWELGGGFRVLGFRKLLVVEGNITSLPFARNVSFFLKKGFKGMEESHVKP